MSSQKHILYLKEQLIKTPYLNCVNIAPSYTLTLKLTDEAINLFMNVDSLGVQLGKNNKDVWLNLSNNKNCKIRYKSVVKLATDNTDVVTVNVSKQFTKVYKDRQLVPYNQILTTINTESYVKLLLELVSISFDTYENVYEFDIRTHQIAVKS